MEKPQAAMENTEATSKISALNTAALPSPSSSSPPTAAAAAAAAAATADVNMVEEFGGPKPALLPLFPPCGTTMNYFSPEWSEYLEGGRRPVESRPLDNASMDDDYGLNLLSYSSPDFAPDYSSRTSMVFGTTFFDEVDSFSKVDDADPGVIEPHDHLSAAGVAHYYP